jgi:hypothetical protein
VLKTELIEEIATTGEQEGEREEILARSFSNLGPTTGAYGTKPPP